MHDSRTVYSLSKFSSVGEREIVTFHVGLYRQRTSSRQRCAVVNGQLSITADLLTEMEYLSCVSDVDEALATLL